MYEDKGKFCSHSIYFDLHTFCFNPLAIDKIHDLQIESNCRKHNELDLKVEICTWKGRKHGVKRRKCW